MNFMDILKRPTEIKKEGYFQMKYESMPVYKLLEAEIQKNAGKFSIPVPTILGEIKEAIKQKQKSDEDVPKETTKKEIASVKEALKNIPKAGSEENQYAGKIEKLTEILYIIKNKRHLIRNMTLNLEVMKVLKEKRLKKESLN